MKKVFKEAEIKDLISKVSGNEITFSRLVEILNEKVEDISKPSEDIKQAIEDAARKHCNIKNDLVIDEDERYYKDFQKYDGFKAGAEFALRLSENSGQVAEPSSRSQDNGAELLEAAKQIFDLHVCEMEGLSSGQPTPTEWMNAVDKLSEAISNYENKANENSNVCM